MVQFDKMCVERLDNENNIREKNIREGNPVYGLSKFTEELYLEYETDKIQKAYCDDLSNEGMQISLDEAKKYYEENKFHILSKEEYVDIVCSQIEELNDNSDFVENREILETKKSSTPNIPEGHK